MISVSISRTMVTVPKVDYDDDSEMAHMQSALGDVTQQTSKLLRP